MPGKNNFRPYVVINWVFAIIIGLIFLYTAVYDPEGSNYPIHSAYNVLTGENTISTGLSRSFSAVVRFRFADAAVYNPNGLRVFLFFVVQFIIRIAVLFRFFRCAVNPGNRLIIADSVQLIVMFLFCFWPFLVFWVKII